MENPIILSVRKELKKNSDPNTLDSFRRFFRGKVRFYGVKTGIVGKIASEHWKQIRDRKKDEIMALCEQLYRSGMCEEGFIVNSWAYKLSDRYEERDFKTFERWTDKYITNWATCDGFCNHTVGDFIQKFPQYIRKLKQWTRSGNRWMRRAAAVSLILPARKGKFLQEVMEIAALLWTDQDDMVQKGYGWLLKEASRLHQKEIFDFVQKNKKNMPRTALRYAIELMPAELKQQAMKKDW